MKKVLIVILFLYITSGVYAQNRMIKFDHDSLPLIEAKAKKEHKLIFIDAFTSWCGPCRWMATKVFTNDTVADFFNEHFICAKIDMEKGDGPRIAKLYQVRCYPNLLFIDENGNLVHRSAGTKNVNEFIAFAKTAMDADHRFATFKSNYESNRSDSKALANYIHALSNTCLPADELVTAYFAGQKKENLKLRPNWEMIQEFITTYKSPEFDYVLKHISDFQQLYTNDSVNDWVKTVYTRTGFTLLKASNQIDEAAYAEYKKDIASSGFACADEVLFRMDVAYLDKKSDWKTLGNLLVQKGDQYFKSPIDLNRISWAIYEHSDDPICLNKAASWMKQATEDKVKGQHWFIYDTYAAVLFKLKRISEAKGIAQKAIEMAKAEGLKEDDYRSTEDLLKKME